MADLPRALFEALPWVKPLLLWLLALLILLAAWFVLALPAYLLDPLLKQVRQQLTSFAQRIATRYVAIWQNCGSTVATRLSPFYQAHSFRHVRDKNRLLWEETVRTVVRSAQELAETIRSSGGQLREATNRLGESTARLKSIDVRFPPLPALPDATALLDDTKRVRHEWVNLISGGIITAAIVVVNTGMLSQILKDVLDVGAIKVLGELRLYHLFAALLTLIEAGAGVLFGYSIQEESELSQRIGIWAVVATLFALGLALIEGIFYSRVGPAQEVFTLPGLDIKFNMQQAFFLWGFILPLMLFGLGHACYRALVRIWKGRALKQLASDLKASENLALTLRKAVPQIETSLNEVRESADRAEEVLPHYSKSREDEMVATVQKLKSELEALARVSPEWATKIIEPLTAPEIGQQALRVGVWLVLTIISSVLFVWLQATLVPEMYPRISRTLALLLAMPECAVLLSLGLILRPSGMIVDETGELRIVEAAGLTIGRGVAAVALTFILGFSVWVLIDTAIPQGYGLAWALALGISIGLVALGRELPSMLGLAICCVSAGAAIVEGLLAVLGVWALRLLCGIVLVLEFAVLVLALPAKWVAARFRRAGLEEVGRWN